MIFVQCQIQFFSLTSNWFTANKLIQNLNKTNVIKSVKNNSPHMHEVLGIMENI
jgi:hypothetical protein